MVPIAHWTKFALLLSPLPDDASISSNTYALGLSARVASGLQCLYVLHV